MSNDQLLLAAISSLTVVIGYLWRLIISHHAECKQEKDLLWKFVLEQNDKSCDYASICDHKLKSILPRRP